MRRKRKSGTAQREREALELSRLKIAYFCVAKVNHLRRRDCYVLRDF